LLIKVIIKLASIEKRGAEMSDKKIAVAIYARVSTEKQGDSIEHQVSFLKEYMNRNLGDEYYNDESLIYADEGISGYSTMITDRQNISQLLKDAKQGKFNVFLVKEVTRIGRSNDDITKVIDALEYNNVRIISYDGYDSNNKNTKVLLGFRSVIAEIESERISNRVAIGYREKVKKGKFPLSDKHTPLGYKLNPVTQKLDIDETTAYIVREIFDLYVNKRIGSHNISGILNKKGYRTKQGNAFGKNYIRQILINPNYIGALTYGKTKVHIEKEYDENYNIKSKKKKAVKADDPLIVYDCHEPIIDKETFYRAKDIMTKRNKNNQPINRAKYPLTGILYCDKCGGAMICQICNATWNGKKHQYRYYRCTTALNYKDKTKCDQKGIPAEMLEKAVFDFIISEFEKVKSNYAVIDKDTKEQKYRKKIDVLEKEKEKLKKKQKKVTDNEDVYDNETFREIMLDIKKNIQIIDEQILIINNQIQEANSNDIRITRWEEVVKEMRNTDVKEIQALRKIFHEVLDEVRVYDKDRIEHIQFKYSIF
jgi:DNA invertase Pin-like site-specific DNA recombinase